MMSPTLRAGRLLVATVMLVALTLSICVIPLGAQSVSAADAPEPDELTVLSFNIRSARGDGLVPSYEERHLRALAEMIGALAPDVVLLQELDRGVARSERVDQFAYLEEATGMDGRFARTVNYQGGRFGLAVLTVHEIVAYEHVVLPQLGGKEPRALQQLRIRLPSGREMDLFNTHIDPRLVSRDRQIRLVLRHTERLLAGPALLAGDFNATPSSGIMETMRTEWRDAAAHGGGDTPPATYPTRAPMLRIDYVFVRGSGLELVGIAYPDPRGISDHLPILVRLRLAH